LDCFYGRLYNIPWHSNSILVTCRDMSSWSLSKLRSRCHYESRVCQKWSSTKLYNLQWEYYITKSHCHIPLLLDSEIVLASSTMDVMTSFSAHLLIGTIALSLIPYSHSISIQFTSLWVFKFEQLAGPTTLDLLAPCKFALILAKPR
jgi:hypothetical protein